MFCQWVAPQGLPCGLAPPLNTNKLRNSAPLALSTLYWSDCVGPQITNPFIYLTHVRLRACVHVRAQPKKVKKCKKKKFWIFFFFKKILFSQTFFFYLNYLFDPKNSHLQKMWNLHKNLNVLEGRETCSLAVTILINIFK